MSGINQSLKRLSVVILLCLIGANITAANSPDQEFFYYSGNRKNALTVSNKMIAVRFKENTDLEIREQVINSEANLELFSKRQEFLTFKLTLIPLREGKSKENALQTVNSLKNRSEVEIAGPVFNVQDTELIATDEFIVKFKPTVSQKEIDAFNELNGVEIVRKPEWTNRYTLRVKDPANMNTLKTANFYYENPITIFSMPNFINKLKPSSTIPDDTYFGDQWHLDNTGQDPPAGTEDADINALEGWPITVGDPDIVIAILDAGVDLTHEDLADNIVGGYDFVDDDTDATPSGNDAHGTACAGLAAGVTKNDKGISGVSWNCKIMPIRIAVTVSGFWITSEEQLANGIEWASDNGADVLSNSWNGPDSDIVHNAIKEAKNNGRDGKGCVVVFSSGNSNPGGPVAYPAKYSEVIAVGATDEDDLRWYYSGYGSELDVVAPSGDIDQQGNIWTTDITGSAGYNYGNASLGDAAGNYTNKMGGTSAAAPQVAGLAGLILSVNPYLTSNQVQEIIETTADDKGTTGWDEYYGWGRINVYNAVLKAANLELNIEDGINQGDCVVPDDEINYYISYSNPITDSNGPGYFGDVENLVFVDYLSDWVDFDSIWLGSGSYDEPNHVVRWTVSKLSPGQSGDVLIKVLVNDQAEPLEYIYNEVEMTSDTIASDAREETFVCCYDEKVMYVDAYSTAADPNGLSWGTAFKKLEEALTAARTCDEIWVADGTYQPTTDPANAEASFTLRKGIEIYGGFSGNEDKRYERNWADLNNETILSGLIDSFGNDPNRVDYVVVDANSFLTVIDGFTITGGGIAGIYCNNSSPIIQHNRITQNSSGIYCDNTKNITILNNWIYKNAYGIYLDDPNQPAVIQNNTIAYNNSAGIYKIGSTEPLISNCMIWDNTAKHDLINCNATYSLITDGDVGTGNLDGDPNHPPFENIDDDNYHINPNSDPNGIDAGDPNGDYTGQRDIDKQFRVLDGNDDGTEIVDMGADEYCNEGSSNAADFNEDEIVDTLDLAEMAAAWLIDNSDPCWAVEYDEYDLYDDDVIDYFDFAYFAKEWLWMTCEKMQGYAMMETMSMGGGMEMMAMGSISSEALTAPQPVLTIEKQIAQAEGSIEFLENIKDSLGEEDWEGLTESIEEWIEGLEEE